MITAAITLCKHPLLRFSGPRLWAISRLPYVCALAKGELSQRTHELHQQYGPIVRLAPNELSFIDGQAWHDIYGHHQGRPNFPKNPLWMAPSDNDIHSILSANDADHARYRRLLSHAFSERALRQQEHLLLSYIDILIRRRRDCASSPKTAVVGMVKWLKFYHLRYRWGSKPWRVLQLSRRITLPWLGVDAVHPIQSGGPFRLLALLRA